MPLIPYSPVSRTCSILIPADGSIEWIPGPPDENGSLVLKVLLPLMLVAVLFSTPNRPELFWVSIAGLIPVWPRLEVIVVWNGGRPDPMVPPIPDWENPAGETEDTEIDDQSVGKQRQSWWKSHIHTFDPNNFEDQKKQIQSMIQ